MNKNRLYKKAHQLAKLIRRDKEHEYKFQESYHAYVEEDIGKLNQQQELELIKNYEDSLHEYLFLYLTLCIELEENSDNKKTLENARQSIENLHVDYEQDAKMNEVLKIWLNDNLWGFCIFES